MILVTKFFTWHNLFQLALQEMVCVSNAYIRYGEKKVCSCVVMFVHQMLKNMGLLRLSNFPRKAIMLFYIFFTKGLRLRVNL